MTFLISATSVGFALGNFLGNVIQKFSGGLGLGLGMGLGFGISIGAFFDVCRGGCELVPKKTEEKTQ